MWHLLSPLLLPFVSWQMYGIHGYKWRGMGGGQGMGQTIPWLLQKMAGMQWKSMCTIIQLCNQGWAGGCETDTFPSSFMVAPAWFGFLVLLSPVSLVSVLMVRPLLLLFRVVVNFISSLPSKCLSKMHIWVFTCWLFTCFKKFKDIPLLSAKKKNPNIPLQGLRGTVLFVSFMARQPYFPPYPTIHPTTQPHWISLF